MYIYISIIFIKYINIKQIIEQSIYFLPDLSCLKMAKGILVIAPEKAKSFASFESHAECITCKTKFTPDFLSLCEVKLKQPPHLDLSFVGILHLRMVLGKPIITGQYRNQVLLGFI